LSVVHGSSGLDRKGAENTVGNNGYFYSDYDYTLARLGSRYAPHRSLMLNSMVSFTREQYGNLNKLRDPLSTDQYGEWAANFDHTWMFSEKNGLLFGANLRRMRDEGAAWRRFNNNTSQILDLYRGTGVRSGAHLAPMFNFFGGKLAIRAGGRADHHEVNGRTVWSPYASITLAPTQASTLHLGWGHAAQFPELNQFYSRSGARTLMEERSSHLEASFEQRLDERTRFRLEAYNRTDRNLLDRPLYYPHYAGTRIVGGDLAARYYNTLRGYSRGVSVFLQRRTANGITGWVSYTYSMSKMRDDFNQLRLPADYDQRHAANLFLSYRLRPTVNLSSRWVYGSGFPVHGYFERAQPGAQNVFLSPSRNALRLPRYHRWDVRANKTFVKHGMHITLFAELINVYNHSNIRFEDLNTWDARTGSARLSLAKMFPVLPSAGVALEF
ncbi:MAG: TonB-dependent receptor, partial [Acidobacteria bacterium]|nr:TonB-dependent receptor [Acidobacteriota bacterium]